MGANKNVDGRTELSALIETCETVVTYTPLRTELDWAKLLTLPSKATIYRIEPRASLDPIAEAKEVQAIAGPHTVILIPGRRFDASGTRHGQGGGWYDRFLAAAPEAWLRIGFCTKEQFSETLLVRNSLDQPVDYVMADTVLYETHARI